MGKNNKKGQRPKGAPQINPNNQTIRKLEADVVGLEIAPPQEWPQARRRLFAGVELSLLENPRLRHLSVLPEGCMRVIVQLRNYSPAPQAAVA